MFPESVSSYATVVYKFFAVRLRQVGQTISGLRVLANKDLFVICLPKNA